MVALRLLQSRCAPLHRSLNRRWLSTREMFEHTEGRWLFNEDINLKLRHRPFNVAALESAACQSVEAQRVANWKKIGEGAYNKVFLLEFDNNRKAALRIPCPIVPNVQRTTASEVATMQYLHDSTETSEETLVPKVLTWNASFDSEVGVPYILLDYKEGIVASEKWFLPETKGTPVREVLKQVSWFELTTLQDRFSANGAIYFADDVEGVEGIRPLYDDSINSRRYHPKNWLHLSEKYRIGPSVQREWYRDVYEQLDVFRGPWPDMQSMLRDAVDLQMKALDTGVAFKNPYIRSTPEDKAQIIRLLNMVLSIADIIVPEDPCLTRPALNHPDITVNNLIFHKDINKGLTAMIDWQGANVQPMCIASKPADIFTYYGSVIDVNGAPMGKELPYPEGFDSMSPMDQDAVRLHHRLAMRHNAYNFARLHLKGDRPACIVCPSIDILMNLTNNVLRVISDGQHGLWQLLFSVQQNWECVLDISADQSRPPCPIDFSPAENEEFARRYTAFRQAKLDVAELCYRIGCDEDGFVATSRYEEAKKALEVHRQQWNVAEKGPFPLVDGRWWSTLT